MIFSAKTQKSAWRLHHRERGGVLQEKEKGAQPPKNFCSQTKQVNFGWTPVLLPNLFP